MVWNVFATAETKISFRSSIYYKPTWLKEHKCNKEETWKKEKFISDRNPQFISLKIIVVSLPVTVISWKW